MRTLDSVDQPQMRSDLPPFRVGDTVRVHVKVREGEKERIQVFEGVVLRRRGAGMSETFTVRKVSYGVGVERTLPLHSPGVTKVEIKSRGFVRRSRLYYLRDLRGKKARLRSKVRDLTDLVAPEPEEIEAPAPATRRFWVLWAVASVTWAQICVFGFFGTTVYASAGGGAGAPAPPGSPGFNAGVTRATRVLMLHALAFFESSKFVQRCTAHLCQ